MLCDLIIYAFTGSGFSKTLENKHCYNADHGTYGSISAAMNICITDSNCFGILDKECDGKGDAYLCNAHPKRIETHESHCIYVRMGNVLKDSS